MTDCTSSSSSSSTSSRDPRIAWQPDASLVGLYAAANPRDRQMFFIMRTVALHSFYGAFGRGFWIGDVVRAAQTYPAVWHIGLAVAAVYRSLHDEEMTTSGRSQYLVYGLQQYGKCIRSIIDIARKARITYADKETVLLSNIMLIGFCCMLKDNTSALDHMGKGLQAFYQWRFWEVPQVEPTTQRSTILDIPSVVALFRRFELQYVMSDRIDTEAGWQVQPPAQQPSTAPFTSSTEACAEFMSLQLGFLTASVVHFDTGGLIESSNLAPDHRHTYRVWFNIWKTKLAGFMDTPNFRDSDLECVLTLQIWSQVVEILLHLQKVDGLSRDLAYDEWFPAFERIASLTNQLYDEMAKNADSASLPVLSSAFSFSLSVVEPLSLMGRCRDGTLRRKTISFLRKWPRKDGLWDAKMLASMLETTMLFEEGFSTLDPTARSDDCQCIAQTYICGLHRVVHAPHKNIREGVVKHSMFTELDLQRQKLGESAGTEVMIYY